MEIILYAIIVFLILVIICQFIFWKKRSSNLKYICGKISSIVENDSNERLKIFADDKEIISLLNIINRILDHNQEIKKRYTKTEISIRKMLSNISHDLKTPLTVVLGYIETINLDSVMNREEMQVLLQRVHEKTREVCNLIDKFFDLAKLESGDKDISTAKVNMNEVCKKNILAFYDILTNKGMEVVIDLPEKNVYAWGNNEALDRVMNNLISNAIRYGCDGNIIGLSLRIDDKYVYVDVWDKGRGIDEAYRDRVFERMYTLDDSRNKVYQGSGLGLTITKRLVEKLGGEISLESKPYEKTVFSVKLKRIAY